MLLRHLRRQREASIKTIHAVLACLAGAALCGEANALVFHNDSKESVYICISVVGIDPYLRGGGCIRSSDVAPGKNIVFKPGNYARTGSSLMVNVWDNSWSWGKQDLRQAVSNFTGALSGNAGTVGELIVNAQKEGKLPKGFMSLATGFQDDGWVLVYSGKLCPIVQSPVDEQAFTDTDGCVKFRPKVNTVRKAVVLKGFAGKCLDAKFVDGRNFAGKGSVVQLWECSGGANQKWDVDGATLRLAGTQNCLATVGGKTEWAARLMLWDCHGGKDEQWAWRNGLLLNTSANLCADVQGEGSGNGNPVVLYSCVRGKANQNWDPS